MAGEAVLTRRLIYPKKRGHTEIRGQCLTCGKVEDYAADYPFNICDSCRAKLSKNYVFLVERVNGEDGDPVQLTGRYAKISRELFKQVRPEKDLQGGDTIFVVFPSTFYLAVCLEYISKLRPLLTAAQLDADRLQRNEEEGKRLKAETEKLQGDLEAYEGLRKAVQADIDARSPEEREETYKEILRQVEICKERRLRT